MAEDNSTIYSFPVSINDVESSIRIEEIYDGNNYTYYTLGIWDSNDNPNVYTRGGRSYLPIKSGTTISPIYDVFNLETSQYESEYGDDYTINGDFEFLFTKLKQYDNIIIKFGRFIPNQEKHYDEVLGVELASPNQYARRIS